MDAISVLTALKMSQYEVVNDDFFSLFWIAILFAFATSII